MIFQEPMLALDPVYTIGEQIVEAIVPPRGRVSGRRRTRARSSCSSACASLSPSAG